MDNMGLVEKNVGLGLARVEVVKQFLVKVGVFVLQVIMDFKGDVQLVVFNVMEEGCYQNCWVEVCIEL